MKISTSSTKAQSTSETLVKFFRRHSTTTSSSYHIQTDFFISPSTPFYYTVRRPYTAELLRMIGWLLSHRIIRYCKVNTCLSRKFTRKLKFYDQTSLGLN